METTTYFPSNGTFGNLTNSPKPTPTTSTLELAFRWCVFLAGTIGLLANALVVFALSSKKLQKRTSNVLIRSQVFFDLLVCACLMLSYGYRVWFDEIPLSSNSIGNFVCIAVYGNGLLAVTLCASLANLGIIAFERYVKIVHLVKHRNYFRRWMLAFAIAFCIAQGVLLNIPFLWTSGIINGVCYPLVLWPSRNSRIAYIWIRTTWQYLLLLVVFVLCYGNIVKVVRKRREISTATVYFVEPSSKSNAHSVTSHAHNRQTAGHVQHPTSHVKVARKGMEISTATVYQVEPSLKGNAAHQVTHNAAPHVHSHVQQSTSHTRGPMSSAQNESYNRREVNIVKTMIIISMSYAITNFPSAFFSICWAHNFIFTPANQNIALYNSIVFFICYINICLNPFIYVASHREIKAQLLKILRPACTMEPANR